MTPLLGSLPADHPLRNAALIDIGAVYRWKKSKGGWKEVKPEYKIARCTFNDLGEAWTASDDWRATKELAQ